MHLQVFPGEVGGGEVAGAQAGGLPLLALGEAPPSLSLLAGLPGKPSARSQPLVQTFPPACCIPCSGSPVLLPIVQVAELFWLTRPCPHPQDEADAHRCQLLVLQPGHSRALREPQLLGLSAL